MSSQFPMARNDRQTQILVGDDVTATFGPFDFKIFDVEDIDVWQKLDGEDAYSLIAVTVTKTSATAFSDFTITFPAAVLATTSFCVVSARVHERSTDVTRNGTINSMALERELSAQGTVLQEHRRDIDQSVRTDFGETPPRLNMPAIGEILVVDADGNIGGGGTAGDILGWRNDAVDAAIEAEAAKDAVAAWDDLAQAWAESPTPPDPDDATSRSAKTIAETLGTLSELEALAERGETAETGAVTAQGLAEAAQGLAEAARGLAEAAQDAAQAVSVTGSHFTSGGPVATASTANLTLFSEQTIDGVLTSTDRVLVKDQTAPEDNGIYVTAAGIWARATDMNAAGEVQDTAVYVSGGTTQGGMSFATYSAVTTLGTDAIAFVQISNNSGAQDQIDTLNALVDPLSGTTDSASSFIVAGSANKIGARVANDGSVRAASLSTRKINRHILPSAAITLGKTVYGGNYQGHSLFTATLGQSLGQSHVGGINETLAQIGRSYGYRYNDDTPAYATDRLVAVADDFAVSGGTIVNRDGENPMFGLMGHTFEMMRTERGLELGDYAMNRVSANNAAGSSTITQNNQGTARYNRTIAQVTQELAWANANGMPVICPGNLWLQGESEHLNTKAYYLDKLTELALDYATDIRAVLDGSGASYDQTFDPHLFTYATCGRPISGGATVARAQLQASVDYHKGVTQAGQAKPAPVILTNPTYFMSHERDLTGIHVPSHEAYMLGAYGALAIQRMFIDEWDDDDPAHAMNLRWSPMYPTNVRFLGGTALIKYNMRVVGTKLQFGVSDFPNGEGVSEQETYGFAVWDTVGESYKAIGTPEIVAHDTVAIRLSSGSFAVGDRIGYALDRPAKNWTFFTGNAGNLRDNHGDYHRCERLNMPMHNWLAPHFITKDASGAGWTIS